MQLLHTFAKEPCTLLVHYGFKLLPRGSHLHFLVGCRQKLAKSAEPLELNVSTTLLILLLPVQDTHACPANI